MILNSAKKPAKTIPSAKEKSVGVSAKPQRKQEEKEVSAVRTNKASSSAKTGHGGHGNEKPRAPAGRTKSDERIPIHGKAKKPKLLKDSYSISESERQQIDALKKRCADHGAHVKKSHLLRAGIQTLVLMDDSELLIAIGRVGI
jgi:hypothetical protein